MIVSRGADQKARGLWERDWKISARPLSTAAALPCARQ